MISLIDLIIGSGAFIVVVAAIYSIRIKYNMSLEAQNKRMKQRRQTYRVSRRVKS